ncbi:NINE protein [Mobiluncus mulieris]|uniref:NINE protein n=1 Tax=Mobiluncus mulieris TaxID=2052 RepID=UPI00207AC3D4|nr:TM2 domain-containing protein [Mobiluncus mulieris]
MSNNMPLNNPYAPLPNQNLSNQGLPNQSYPGQGSSNQGMPNFGYGTSSGLPMGFREVDKVLYVVLTFFIGSFGVHRFLRGQVGIGILGLVDKKC